MEAVCRARAGGGEGVELMTEKSCCASPVSLHGAEEVVADVATMPAGAVLFIVGLFAIVLGCAVAGLSLRGGREYRKGGGA